MSIDKFKNKIDTVEETPSWKKTDQRKLLIIEHR